ncbi:MAG: ion transporter [Bacteroidia bacterium]|nr:MAG: ion transporter [Bacteroidia bacterium]
MTVNLRGKIFVTIFGTETRGGRTFDIVLLWMIILSVSIVVLESVSSIRETYHDIFVTTEWIFTISFTLEYMLRIYSSPRPLKYITSFYGLVDLLAILPTFLGLVFDQYTFLLTIRALRLFRMFRVFKLARYVKEAAILVKALQLSKNKIIVFFGAVLTLVLILGSLLYLIEGEENGFTSIPQSVYWAIVTITTVGYGDIAPVTVLGKILASVAMLTGFSIIAVPTGIISVEIGKAVKSSRNPKQALCTNCGHDTHDSDAHYCKICGTKI